MNKAYKSLNSRYAHVYKSINAQVHRIRNVMDQNHPCIDKASLSDLYTWANTHKNNKKINKPNAVQTTDKF